MKLGFIGAGKVGFTLGRFFSQGGVPVTGYWSRHRESAAEAAAFTGTRQYDSLEALVQDSDALFLTVTDAAIPEVFQTLTEYDLTGKDICHCSGALTAREAFPGIETTGAHGCSVHPLFPISSKYDVWEELAGAFFCLEGDPDRLEDWRTMITALGPQVRLIPSEGKVRYHAACAVSSNLMCALVQESLDLLADCGFSEEDALAALAPLMRSNLEHIIQDGPTQALTGPAERGDAQTVEKHLACLPTREEQDLYRAATAKLLEIAGRKHPERSYESLQYMIKQER